MAEERYGYYIDGDGEDDAEIGVGNATTPEEAIKEAIAEFGIDACKGKLHIGKAVRADFPVIKADYILQDCEDAMLEEYGEQAEGWLAEVPAEAVTELETRMNDLIRQWLEEKDIWPDWYEVDEGDLVDEAVLQSALKEIATHDD